MTLTPLTAAQALDAYYLEARAKLLDLAAIFDRIDRGGGSDDPRAKKLQAGVGVLLEADAGRAQRLQELFSLGYDVEWRRPQPR